MVDSEARDHTTANAVEMTLEPGLPRQLGEEGLLVFWRDGNEPGQREGLLCILSMCPHPECSCPLVYVDGFLIEGNVTRVLRNQEGVHLDQPEGAASGEGTVGEKMMVIVDPATGETTAHPDTPTATDPTCLQWLASEMNGELLEALHRFRARAKGYPPEGPRLDIDLHELEKYHLAAVDDVLEGTRSDAYILGDGRYWAATYLCPTPGCNCHKAEIVFFDEEGKPDEAVGSLLLDISGAGDFAIEKRTLDSGPEHLRESLWALFDRRHDVAHYLRRREAELKAVGETLWRPAPKPVRADPKPGRNAPCPCGSGRKFKKCCLRRDEGPFPAGYAPKRSW